MAAGSLSGGDTQLTYGAVGLHIVNMQANGSLREPFDHLVSVWDVTNNAYAPYFPRDIEDWQMLNNPVIADITGNGMPDVFEGSAGYQVWAWNADGTIPPGWPKFTGGWLLASVAVGNVDAKSNASAPNAVQWADFHHDLWHTGNYQTALPVRNGRLAIAAATREGYLYLWKAPGSSSGSSGGCSCNTTGSTHASDIVLSLLIGIMPFLFLLFFKRKKKA